MSIEEVHYQMDILAGIQLAKELGEREGFPRENSFRECVQKLMDLEWMECPKNGS